MWCKRLLCFSSFLSPISSRHHLEHSTQLTENRSPRSWKEEAIGTIMSEEAMATQSASPGTLPERTDDLVNVNATIVEKQTQEQQTPTESRNDITTADGQDQAVPAEGSTAVKSEHTEAVQTTNDSTVATELEKDKDAVVESEADGTASTSVPASPKKEEAPTLLAEVVQSEASLEQDDSDFVPPDMEHIVNTGATQDGAASMQALRELVAQARASSGQPREALPPGFGDEEEAEAEASSTPPVQAQRGEKRKAEVELEELVQSSAGIEEVKAAAEKSQHPETKTLLQKALSSISGLVSRRPKVETASTAAASTSTSTEQLTEQPQPQSKVDGEEADSSNDSSSDSDSDSDSSSGDSSDDEDEDDVARNVGLALVGDDDDDEDGGPSGSTVLATKNEILAPDVEQPTVKELTDEEKQTMRKLGRVHSIVDSVVVIEQDVQQSKQADSTSATGTSVPVDSTGRRGEREGEYSVLDTGSLLCFEDGKVLGLVFETFGSIHNPMYSIRFASAAAIDRDIVKTGKPVFYLPVQSTYVMTQLLRSMKGSDASNMWDEEVAEDEIDYSDDEQEAEAKRRAKAIRSGKVDEQGNPIGAASKRGDKRQKQGAGQASSSGQHPSNGAYQQQSNRNGSQYTPLQRPTVNAAVPPPARNNGGPGLPRPPAPAGPSSLGPAFPHGLASLPPKPIAGLPSKPTFQAEPSSSSTRQPLQYGNGNVTPDSLPRSRMGTAEGTPGGPSHSRMHSAAASSLPAKPVDAAAAAAAAAAAQQHGARPSIGGASSPTQPSRASSMGRAAHAPYAHQGSPGWYAGTGSAPSSTPASPAAPSRHAGPAGSAYSPGGAAAGAGAATAQGGHYNPAYAGHWQQAYGPGSASARPAYPAPGMPWNAPPAYQSPPMHMAPGAMAQQSYSGSGGYGGSHAGYGAPVGAAWNAQTYPGSHYPGYADPSYQNAAGSHAHQGHYAPSAQAYGYGAYPGQAQAAGVDAYSAYGYNASASHASATAGSATPATPQSQADGYDPRSPSMKNRSNQQS